MSLSDFNHYRDENRKKFYGLKSDVERLDFLLQGQMRIYEVETAFGVAYSVICRGVTMKWGGRTLFDTYDEARQNAKKIRSCLMKRYERLTGRRFTTYRDRRVGRKKT